MIAAIERQASNTATADYSLSANYNRKAIGVYEPNEFEDFEMNYEISEPCKRLWLAVIEQAVFDAHLHSTGGNYPSVVWVEDAREYFDTEEFELACDYLEVSPDWVRSMNQSVERLARKLRGREYDAAARPKHVKRKPRQAAKHREFYQLVFIV